MYSVTPVGDVLRITGTSGADHITVSRDADDATKLVVNVNGADPAGVGASVVVDPEGVIRFASVNDLNVGRNPQEVLRVLDALQTDELCPCNWKKGEEFLKAA